MADHARLRRPLRPERAAARRPGARGARGRRPRPGPGAGEESHSLWLDLRAFSDDVERALGRVRDGQAELNPGPSLGVRVGNDLLIRPAPRRWPDRRARPGAAAGRASTASTPCSA